MSTRDPSRTVALIDVQHREVRKGWSAPETLSREWFDAEAHVSLPILSGTCGPWVASPHVQPTHERPLASNSKRRELERAEHASLERQVTRSCE